MNIDFALIMVIALFITGIVWALDAATMAPKRRELRKRLITIEGVAVEEAELRIKAPIWVEYARSFFPVILIVLLLRSFLVEPFRIPSASMMPTLVAGDFILVNKFKYGLRLPVIGEKFVNIDEPHRGDVVVFRYPRDPSIDYIKRVIGLPGDIISYHNRQVFVNGKPAALRSLGTYTGLGAALPMSGSHLLEERLDGVTHDVLITTNRPSVEGEYRVPAGRYFVMGDNRDNSNDSRFWGTVPEQNLVGKAFMIWMNWDSQAGSITWSRIGSSIK